MVQLVHCTRIPSPSQEEMEWHQLHPLPVAVFEFPPDFCSTTNSRSFSPGGDVANTRRDKVPILIFLTMSFVISFLCEQASLIGKIAINT